MPKSRNCWAATSPSIGRPSIASPATAAGMVSLGDGPRATGRSTIRRPRVRGLAQRFASRLPLFVRRTPEVDAVLPELYLHGLAVGDCDLALRGLLGDDAPLSATTVARLKAQWHAEYAQWANRTLADREVVYLWVDGVYVKAGLEKEKAAVLVVLAALRDGRKELVALVPGHRESTEAWSDVLRDLKARGLHAPTPVIDRDWNQMLTFSRFPQAHWVHLRTSNPIESPFAALRLRTDAAKRFKKIENATAVVWKMLLVAQGRFRRLTAPELLQEVYHGAQYVNGVRVTGRAGEVVA